MYYWLTIFSPSAVNFSLGSPLDQLEISAFTECELERFSWDFRAGAPSPLSCLPLARLFFLAHTASKRLLPRLVFFLFFQPLSCLRHSLKPGASFVLKLGQCISRLDVPKLIGVTVFDHKTVSHAFLDSTNHLWSQIFVYILEKTPFRDSSFPFHLILPWKFCNQGIITKYQSNLLAPVRLFYNASNERDQIFPTPLRGWFSEFFWFSWVDLAYTLLEKASSEEGSEVCALFPRWSVQPKYFAERSGEIRM